VANWQFLSSFPSRSLGKRIKIVFQQLSTFQFSIFIDGRGKSPHVGQKAPFRFPEFCFPKFSWFVLNYPTYRFQKKNNCYTLLDDLSSDGHLFAVQELMWSRLREGGEPIYQSVYNHN
jgi:hypothetical protein